MTLRIVLVFLTVTIAILGSLFVFDAIDFDTLKDNALKLVALAAIAIATSGVITVLMGGEGPTKK